MRARVLLGCAVLLAVLSLAGTSWAAPLLLSDLETEADFSDWIPHGFISNCPAPCTEQPATLTRVAAHATEGSYSLQVDCTPGEHMGMDRTSFVTNDWTGYNTMFFDVENPTAGALSLHLEISDTIHGGGWVHRYLWDGVLTPGVNHISIPLVNLWLQNGEAELDLAHIDRISFGVSGQTGPLTYWFDNFRLDNVQNDPYTDAARNIWKFDCGTWDSPVWPDFFCLAHNMNYPQDPATRPFGWVVPTGDWHNKQANDWYGPEDLARDFVRRCCPTSTPMDFRLDLPNGDYRVYLIARGADWSGFPTEGWSVTSEGVEVLSVPMDVTTFYADWYYRGMNEDYPLSASAWECFEVPQFPAYTFGTTVADGSLNLHFDGRVGVFAMIVYPASLESEMAARIAGYDAARRAQFEQSYYITQPASLAFTATPEEIARGYAAWPGRLMDPCHPDTLPPDPRPGLTLSTFAVQGEYRSVSLAIRPLVTISGVAVAVTDLSDGAGHVIPNTEMEAQHLRYMVTGDAEFFGSGLLSWKPRLLQKDFPISVPAQVSKEFWITVHVPEGTPGGTYTGTVSLQTSSGDLSVPLSVQVYPYPLDAGNEQAWGWYYNSPESAYLFDYWPELSGQGDVFLHKDFADLKKHGFNSLQFPAPGVVVSGGHVIALNTTQLERYITTAREEGFGGDWIGQANVLGMAGQISNATGFAEFSPEFNIAYKEALALFVAWMDSPQGAPLAIWLVDEPRETQLNSWNRNFADTMQYATLAHEVPGAITTVTVMAGSGGGVDYGPFVDALDIMQTHPWPNSENLMQGAYAAGKPDWFFNTGGDLRMVYGFYQYKYGRGNGAWEWHLDWMDGEMFDPWPYSPFNNHWRYFYPSPDGPVPTPAYELASQGTYDYRYIATLDRLITEANASGDPEMVERAACAQTLLDAIKADTPAYAVDNGYVTQHFAGASNSRDAEELIEAYRRQLADMILFMTSPSEEHTFSVSVDPASPSTVASGGTTSLSASATDSYSYHTVTWSWNDGGAGGSFSSATARNPTYTAPANTSGSGLTVTLSVTGTCSGTSPLSDTKTTGLTVQSAVHTFSVSVSPASPATVASGGSTDLSASAADSLGHTVAWSWNDGGAGGAFSPSASVQDPSYTSAHNLGASSVYVTLTVSATCAGPSPATDTASTTLMVQPYVGAAEVSASGFPSALLWGAAGSGSVTCRNTGAFTWDPAAGYHLVAYEGINRWGQEELPLSATVLEGGSTTFTLSLVAPPVTTLRYDGSFTPTAPVQAALDCAWDLAKGDYLLTGGSASSPVVISRFPDEQPGTDGAWARAQIEACAGRVPQIVGGYPSGNYEPRITVTRDQMAVFIQRTLDLPLEAFVGHFPDVTAGDAWCNQQIEAMWRAGLIGGYPDGTYRPTMAVDRLQMAAYIARGMLHSTTIPPGPPTPSFPDVAPDAWGGYDAVEYLKTRTVVGGYPDGHYYPEIAVTRDQMAVFICRGFIQPTAAPIVLGGPAVTAQDPDSGGECGWASTATAPVSAPGYAYVAFDAYRLAESMAADGDWRVRFELRDAATPSAPAIGDYTFTRALTAADIHAARAAAFATGYPHWTASWAIPTTLTAGGYVLVVSAEDAHGAMREVSRRPAFSLAP